MIDGVLANFAEIDAVLADGAPNSRKKHETRGLSTSFCPRVSSNFSLGCTANSLVSFLRLLRRDRTRRDD